MSMRIASIAAVVWVAALLLAPHAGGADPERAPDAPAPAAAAPAAEATPPQIILDTQRPPQYPPAALQARYSGSVLLEVRVLPSGSVGEVHVVECTRPRMGFEEAAVAAVKQWRFEPALQGERPVEFPLKFRLNFKSDASGSGKAQVSAGQFAPARPEERPPPRVEQPANPR